MADIIIEIFSYNFIVRAIAVGVMVSLCAALLGVSLVLKRYSMIGDGLGHVGFGSLCIAIALNTAPLAVSVPVMKNPWDMMCAPCMNEAGAMITRAGQEGKAGSARQRDNADLLGRLSAALAL